VSKQPCPGYDELDCPPDCPFRFDEDAEVDGPFRCVHEPMDDLFDDEDRDGDDEGDCGF
jgi:hypothetical protein